MIFSLYYLLFISFGLWLFSILAVPFCSYNSIKKTRLIKKISLFFSIFQFFIVLLFWILTDNINLFVDFEMYNFHFYKKWLFLFNFYYVIGLDNISLLFLLLTFFLTPVCILISWNSIKYKYDNFIICLIFITFILFNIFCVLDLVFFYIFFESILIPMFILIGVWGSRQRKIHAVYQLFFYTLIGSLLMLLGILVIYSHIQTTDIRVLYNTNFSFYRQSILWLSFFFAFCVKVPLFPFHIWLPEAHVEAPTVGSVILAGVLLKLGTYGLLRFVIPIFCDATYFFLPLVYTLCILGIIYTCCSTIRQVDLKKVIAYASVSHMSFVILGLFTSNLQGIGGSIFLMLSHGIVSSGLFFCIGCIYDRYKTRILRYYSGLVATMPIFSLCLFILILSNISFPGTSSFIGEFLILVGLFENNHFAALIATLSIILTAVYSIWLYNRIIFNRLSTSYYTRFSDFSKKEFVIGFTFCFITILFGLKGSYIISLLEAPLYVYLMFK
jgi:proton-translocating NADH-quinone oxidoreductase chain M